MAKKDKEQQAAYYYYVEKGLTAKEVAVKVAVAEKTLSTWVNKFGWKAEREARAMSPKARVENLEVLLSDMAAQRIELNNSLREAIDSNNIDMVREIRVQIAMLDDGASKWNKRLENSRKDGEIHMTTYLFIMEQIFDALRVYNYELFIRTMDFQTLHVQDLTIKQRL